jgi:hypothetical protein
MRDIKDAANVQMVMKGGTLYTISDLVEPFVGTHKLSQKIADSKVE